MTDPDLRLRRVARDVRLSRPPAATGGVRRTEAPAPRANPRGVLRPFGGVLGGVDRTERSHAFRLTYLGTRPLAVPERVDTERRETTRVETVAVAGGSQTGADSPNVTRMRGREPTPPPVPRTVVERTAADRLLTVRVPGGPSEASRPPAFRERSDPDRPVTSSAQQVRRIADGRTGWAPPAGPFPPGRVSYLRAEASESNRVEAESPPRPTGPSGSDGSERVGHESLVRTVTRQWVRPDPTTASLRFVSVADRGHGGPSEPTGATNRRAVRRHVARRADTSGDRSTESEARASGGRSQWTGESRSVRFRRRSSATDSAERSTEGGEVPRPAPWRRTDVSRTARQQSPVLQPRLSQPQTPPWNVETGGTDRTEETRTERDEPRGRTPSGVTMRAGDATTGPDRSPRLVGVARTRFRADRPGTAGPSRAAAASEADPRDGGRRPPLSIRQSFSDVGVERTTTGSPESPRSPALTVRRGRVARTGDGDGATDDTSPRGQQPNGRLETERFGSSEQHISPLESIVSRHMDADPTLDRLVDTLFDKFERKLRIERERRGR